MRGCLQVSFQNSAITLCSTDRYHLVGAGANVAKTPRDASSRCRHICLARVTNPNGFVAAIFRSAGHFECHFVYTTVSFEPRNFRNATRTCRVSKNYNSNFAAFKMLLMLSLTKNIILSERFFNEGYFSLEKLMNFIF